MTYTASGKDRLPELNNLLQNSKIDLPERRRLIGNNGSNFEWVAKNIHKRNSNLDPALLEILSMDSFNHVRGH